MYMRNYSVAALMLWMGTALAHVIPTGTPKEIFTTIFEKNLWYDTESVSGHGSKMESTDLIRSSLPLLIQHYGIKSVLDVPCGDFNWLSKVDLGNCLYIGIDIVEELVKRNIRLYANSLRIYKHGDAIKDMLPAVDLILCRDMFVHFNYDSIYAALRNFKRSGSTYLLLTTQPFVEGNKDIQMGDWRPLNFQKAPFNFPAPVCFLLDREHHFDKGCTKFLGLWKISDLPL